MEHVEQATAAPGEVRDLPPLERVQVMGLEPGDVIIATVPDHTSAREASRIADALKRQFRGHEVVLVTAGIELSVQRAE